MDAFPLFSENQFLVELVVKGTLLMAIAFTVTFLLRKKSAAVRHAVWSLAFVGLLLLPAGAAFLPSWYITLPETVSRTVATPTRYERPQPVYEESEAVAAPAVQVPTTTAPPESSLSWKAIALLLWLAGAMVLFMRMAIVLNKLSLVRRSAIPVTDREWSTLAEVLPEVLRVRRPVALLQHEEVHVPMTYGVRKPVILLPIQANDWSEDQKRITLMHELLHVKRLDYVVHVLALAARALHWFNPLAWMAAKRLVVERERACDDGVLEMGVASTSYADHLLDMARFVLSGNEASTAALAMARPSELRSRVVAILNPIQPRRGLTPMRIISMTVSAFLIVVLVAAVQPGRQIAKRDLSPVQVIPPSVTDAAGSIGKGIRNLAALITKDSVETPETVVEEERPEAEASDTTDLEARRRAIHAISELPEERSIPLLRDIAESHSNQQLREEAIFWLGQVGNGSVAELLESFARNDVSEEVQKKAVFALSQLDDELGVPHLIDLAGADLSEEVRQEVVFWLGEAGGARVADDLEAFARNDESEGVQRKAIFALAELDDGAGVDRLIELARTHPNPDMQAEAVFWMGEAGGTEVAETLADFARNGKNREIQKKALFALSEVDDNAGVPYLIELARSHPDQEVRGEAIFWLGETNDPRAADILMDIVNGN